MLYGLGLQQGCWNPATPPVTRTCPLFNIVAACRARSSSRLAAGVETEVTGSNSSATNKLYHSGWASLSKPCEYPPATSTVPLGSRVAECESRAMRSLPAVSNKLLVGSYISALSRETGAAGAPPPTGAVICVPPSRRTLPLGRRVAVWCARAWTSDPVELNRPEAGSNRSAVPVTVMFPTNSTLPLVSKVAVCCARGKRMFPVRVKLPVLGSYSSALDSTAPPLSWPPAIKTLPFASSVADAPVRAWFRSPVAVEFCVTGSNSSAVLNRFPFEVPPATNTLPSWSGTEQWPVRTWSMVPLIAAKLPRDGTNNSALCTASPVPPTRSTLPSLSRLAVWPERATAISLTDAKPTLRIVSGAVALRLAFCADLAIR